MNIKYKENHTVEYKSLFRGDFFIYEGVLYLKLSTSDEQYIYNAFNCETQILSSISPNLKVRPINIELQEV